MASKEQMLASLGEMGFSGNRCARALKATDYKGVEPAMEWLLAHADDAAMDEPLTEEEATDWTGGNENGEGEDEGPARAPLTEEERAEKLAKLEKLRVQKRAEREEREKKEAIEKEKKRIKEGQGMSDIKQQLAEQEIKKMAELRRREKMETKNAKAKVLAQIEADKIARREKFNMGPGDAASPEKPAPAPAPVTAAPKKDYNEARLQIRQSNGQPLVHTFGAKEPLSAVRLYVQMNRTDGADGQVKLMTNFPKKIFADDDYDNTLENLGLTPSAVLIVTK